MNRAILKSMVMALAATCLTSPSPACGESHRSQGSRSGWLTIGEVCRRLEKGLGARIQIEGEVRQCRVGAECDWDHQTTEGSWRLLSLICDSKALKRTFIKAPGRRTVITLTHDRHTERGFCGGVGGTFLPRWVSPRYLESLLLPLANNVWGLPVLTVDGARRVVVETDSQALWVACRQTMLAVDLTVQCAAVGLIPPGLCE